MPLLKESIFVFL